MKLGTFKRNRSGEAHVGALVGGGLVDLTEVMGVTDLKSLLGDGLAGLVKVKDAVQRGSGKTIPEQDVILLPWNDPEALEKTLAEQGHEIAAVISEPVMCNSGCIQPQPGYLERMRDLTKKHGVVMILDEVITGFRLSLGGAHGRFGLTPDLALDYGARYAR